MFDGKQNEDYSFGFTTRFITDLWKYVPLNKTSTQSNNQIIYKK